MIIIDGKKIAEQILVRIKTEIKAKDLRLNFHCLLVGDDPASRLYISRKEETALKLGVSFTLHHLPANSSPEEVKSKIYELNKLDDGYIIQLPLPEELKEFTDELLNLIDPKKDADGLTKINREKFLNGNPDAFLPTPIAAVAMLLASLVSDNEIIFYLPFVSSRLDLVLPTNLRGGKGVIVSDGDVFGQTLKSFLVKLGMSVEITRSDSKELATRLLGANLVISAIGRPDIVTGDMVSDGVTIIDVGTTLVDGKTKGDVNWESIVNKASSATPVPGGVGPVTVAMLYANLLFLKLKN